MKTTRRDFLCLSAMACAWLLTGCQNPTVEERAVSWQQQEVSDPVSETGPMWNAALDDNAVLRDGIRVPQNFELPLEGSTGFAGAAVMLLYERPDGTSTGYCADLQREICFISGRSLAHIGRSACWTAPWAGWKMNCV